MNVTLGIILKFDAAHFLPGYIGDCGRLHGHTWKVEVRVKGRVGKSGMLVDFKRLKAMVKETLPDHRCVNDYLHNPTAENIAGWLFKRIEEKIKAKLVMVTVWESEAAYACVENK